MPVQVVSNFGESEDDVVARQRREHQAKQYDKAVFHTEAVSIEFGPKKAKEVINLRFEVGSSYAFACYQDNPAWQERGREEWTAASTEALEKFTAMRAVQIIAGPRPEITNRYNMFVEVRGQFEASRLRREVPGERVIL